MNELNFYFVFTIRTPSRLSISLFGLTTTGCGDGKDVSDFWLTPVYPLYPLFTPKIPTNLTLFFFFNRCYHMVSLSDVKEKVAAVFGVLVIAWIVCPLPEISILVGLVSGKTMSSFLPRWFSWTLAFCGAVIGTAIVHDYDLVSRIKSRFG